MTSHFRLVEESLAFCQSVVSQQASSEEYDLSTVLGGEVDSPPTRSTLLENWATMTRPFGALEKVGKALA